MEARTQPSMAGEGSACAAAKASQTQGAPTTWDAPVVT